jgi:hypothetical protein
VGGVRHVSTGSLHPRLLDFFLRLANLLILSGFYISTLLHLSALDYYDLVLGFQKGETT